MKKLFLTALGIAALLKTFSQQLPDSSFQSRKLKIDEINLVSSYYNQNGDHAAVTGGIGTQQLTDIANVIDVKLTKYDRKLRKHSFDLELGIDHYTSASSDKIDLKANSSASHADTRIYPSFTWTMENEQKGNTLTAGASFSNEFDYVSRGVNVGFSKKTKDRNGEFSAKVQAYFDQVKLVTPIELRTNTNPRGENEYGSANRTTLAGSLSWSQVINKNLQVAFLADIVHQQGFLSLPFYRVYFTDGSVHQEKLPDNRLKIPLGFRANYFLGDRIIIRTWYRYYKDDWGISSHTVNIEVPVKITSFFSVSPFYRFYNQTAVKYFAPYEQHTAQNEFYTSNYDLSKFNSNFLGAGIRLAPPNGVFGVKHWNMLEIRYGHYTKNINMNANIISLNIKYK
ncbi:hypothetical protein A4D02_23155 [Niastella koreensis]|uniref:DUF3570 domain-containing protein n=2 Tax=Niastella koreensis TaxID=354356 RepID=G8TD23_NIAKG|nr:DUF3570 domain-containing protein [Niastella koreensis]AEV98255.1 hypothetical protein Niako_1897 [Niastella koreensis GR20-10]OQP53291.1 hypothetical protein A4D02_23155 [Niastella koreensis]